MPCAGGEFINYNTGGRNNCRDLLASTRTTLDVLGDDSDSRATESLMEETRLDKEPLIDGKDGRGNEERLPFLGCWPFGKPKPMNNECLLRGSAALTATPPSALAWGMAVGTGQRLVRYSFRLTNALVPSMEGKNVCASCAIAQPRPLVDFDQSLSSFDISIARFNDSSNVSEISLEIW